MLLYSITEKAGCQGLFSFFGLGAEDTGNVIFDASVDSVIIEERNGLPFEEAMGEIFDLTETHFFSFSIITSSV